MRGAIPLFTIGIGPYEDTLCRLDGGIDHNKIKHQTFGNSYIFIFYY